MVKMISEARTIVPLNLDLCKDRFRQVRQRNSHSPVNLPAYNRFMRKLRRWISPMSWRTPPVATLWDSGIYVTILLGVFSVAVAWLGAWYISTEELERTEAAAYQDTANLARAFEEHIIRLIQAHDQILIFARTSYSKDPQSFDLAQWAREQQFATDVTLQIATTDKRGMLTGSNLGMPSTPTDLGDREHFRVHAGSDR